MGIKTFKPRTPTLRHKSVLTFEEITKVGPEKSLLRPLKKSGGRNNHGHITTRFRGGGHKRQYRIVDFRRNKDNVPAKVASVEYDPNRSSNIALLHYRDGEKRYIIAALGLQVGDSLMSGESVEIRVGNSMPLKNIPLGTLVHNIELVVGNEASWRAGQAPMHNSLLKMEILRSFGCHPVKFGWYDKGAEPQLGRLAMWIMKM